MVARFVVSTDIVVFGFDPQEAELKVLAGVRKEAPFKGLAALPGGTIAGDETAEKAARRVLKEKVLGLTPNHLEQLYTFTAPKRDPRQRAISVSYMALVKAEYVRSSEASTLSDLHWVPVSEALGTQTWAFDHQAIVQTAVDRLKNKVRYTPIGFDLLAEEFTIRELRRLYEVCTRETIAESPFRRRVLKTGLLIEAGMQTGGQHRPAPLYRFDEKRYQALVQTGFTFEV